MLHLNKFLVLFIIFTSLLRIISTKIYNEDATEADEDDEEVDEDEFQFLIQSVTRNPNHQLAKFIVSIRHRNYTGRWGDSHFCTGAIYKLDTIITAATCLEKSNPDEMEIIGGNAHLYDRSDSIQERKVDHAVAYFRYSPVSQVYDIAILKLDRPFKRTEQLDTLLIIKNEPTGRDDCTVIGWGSVIKDKTIENNPVYADVKVWDFAKCKQKWLSVSTYMICAVEKDEESLVDKCIGDLGSPIICGQKYLAGLVTFDLGCQKKDFPSVYTDVHQFKSWIERDGAFRILSYYRIFVWSALIQICANVLNL